MNPDDDDAYQDDAAELKPLPGRERQARQTWFWARFVIGVVLLIVAFCCVFYWGGVIGWTVGVVVGISGTIETINAFVNPFSKK